MVSLPNIYNYKNLKLFVLIPLVLMVFGIILSTQIVLDTSLRGGVSIILQTNASINPATLAGEITSSLHVQAPSIAASPGGVQVTLPVNQSLVNAYNYQLAFYADKSNYSGYLVNATSTQIALQQNRGNATLLSELQGLDASINASITRMQTDVQNELGSLGVFGVSNTTTRSPDQLQAVAKWAYGTAGTTYQNQIITSLHRFVPFASTGYSYQQITPTLGSFFLQEFTSTIIVAFILIFFVVLLIFRSFVPSFVVVFGAANDIIVALGAMGLFKIPLGVASVAGLLMLIGYSIDTDVLTAIRILKRGEGRAEDRAYSSMKTGVTMTATAIVAFGVLFIISLVEYVPTYYEIQNISEKTLIRSRVQPYLRISLWCRTSAAP